MKKIRVLELIPWSMCAVCFLFFPQVTASGATSGLHACATGVLPSLFPFFVLTNFWVQSGYTDTLAGLFAPVMEDIFHLPGAAASALILGSIGGYPIGAKTAAQLFRNKHLTKSEAEQTLLFCNNAGPAFVIGLLGAGIFQSIKAGLLLYAIHLISAYLIGIIFRPTKKDIFQKCSDDHSEILPLPQRLTNSISDAGTTAILVCTYVLFFAIISRCVSALITDSTVGCILVGIFELVGGANALSAWHVSLQIKFIMASFFLGLGGICVLLQSLSITQAAGLSSSNLLKGKLFHGIFSGLITAVLSSLLPIPIPCAMDTGFLQVPVVQQFFVLILLIVIAMIFLKESSGKKKENQI